MHLQVHMVYIGSILLYVKIYNIEKCKIKNVNPNRYQNTKLYILIEEKQDIICES